MNDNKIYTTGLIPYITATDLERLTDEGQAIIARELGKAQNQMAFQEDLTPQQVRDLMEALEVTPIWGREGMVIYRLSIEGKILTPMVQSRTADLPPAALLLAQVLMAGAFGLLGIALAAPLAAVTAVLVRRIYAEGWLGRAPTPSG